MFNGHNSLSRDYKAVHESISLSPIKSDLNIDYDKVLTKNDSVVKQAEEIL